MTEDIALGGRIKIFYKNSADLPKCVEGTLMGDNFTGFIRIRCGRDTIKQVSIQAISIVEEFH